ncbi:hypothetical protein SOPP22_14300 [Shewanella sp. OPT22]|nr:hypothetical protein SOPP22_14300 [Shewanella sp. OPT22]
MNKKIKNKQDFLDIVKELSTENQAKWENQTATNFIEAIGAWLNDAEGYYSNSKIDIDSKEASWQLFADAIKASRFYE